MKQIYEDDPFHRHTQYYEYNIIHNYKNYAIRCEIFIMLSLCVPVNIYICSYCVE